MADGRKNNGGHSTKGFAGRKTKAEELGLPALIEDVIGKEGKKALIEAIYKEAKKGSYQHQQLLLAYIYGKPTETHKVDQITDILIKYDGGINDLISPSTSESAKDTQGA